MSPCGGVVCYYLNFLYAYRFTKSSVQDIRINLAISAVFVSIQGMFVYLHPSLFYL